MSTSNPGNTELRERITALAGTCCARRGVGPRRRYGIARDLEVLPRVYARSSSCAVLSQHGPDFVA
jgi:hypothetical protein